MDEISWKAKAIRNAQLMELSDGSRPEEKATRVEVMAMATRAVDAAVRLFVEVLKEAVDNKY